jgi:integration host factor subunit alpha
MTLTKGEMVRNLYANSNLSKERCSQLVESIFELIKEELENGSDVLVSGFGKWSVKAKNPRRGRNPQTGKKLMLEARKVVTFKCSKKLKEEINQ